MITVRTLWHGFDLVEMLLLAGCTSSFGGLQVAAPCNRIIYLSGNYIRPAGRSCATVPLLVPSGGNIAETLDEDRRVDFRKEFEVSALQTEVMTIVLDPVVPSLPILSEGK